MLAKAKQRCAAAGLTNVRFEPGRAEALPFEEWLKITNAPGRVGPLRVVMTALAAKGATAGIGLRLEGEKILFEHTAALTVAVKRAGAA